MSLEDVPETFDVALELESGFMMSDAVQSIVALLKQRANDLPLNSGLIAYVETAIDIAFQAGRIYGSVVLARPELRGEMAAALAEMSDMSAGLVSDHEVSVDLKRLYFSLIDQAILTGRLYGLATSQLTQPMS